MSELKQQYKPIQQTIQFPVSELDVVMKQHRFEPVPASDILEFHQLADQLIEGEIANPEALARVQEWTGRALFLRRQNDKPEALLASIPLTEQGRDALLDGRFGFANAQRSWVCSLTDPCAALLSWGMAGLTPSAQAASVRGLLDGWHGFYNDTPVYARGRSKQGRLLLSRLGFSPCGENEEDSPLYVSSGFPEKIARILTRPSLRAGQGVVA